jgi:hypothetical protein
MQNASSPSRPRRYAGIVAAAVLVIFGVVSAVQGLDGRATVRDALKQEAVVGTPNMTPSITAAAIRKAGLTGVDAPSCSVAGKAVAGGANARCFAQYMRIDALVATGGRTYAQMPRYASKDGMGTDIEAAAVVGPDGRPMNNPARNVWVTETALTTALNASYMAEQISLFGIAVGGAFLLVGLVLGGFMLGSVRVPKLVPARRREPQTVMSGS